MHENKASTITKSATTTENKINGTTYKVTSKYVGQLKFIELLKLVIKKEIEKQASVGKP